MSICGCKGWGELTREGLARLIDHTLLKIDARKKEIEKLCDEAAKFNFFSVCTNPYWVRSVRGLLEGTGVNVCSVSGFPLGSSNTEAKVLEAKWGVDDGADEIDMVMNVGAFKDRDYSFVLEEIERVVEVVGPDRATKVIIETCVLSDGEKVGASRLVKKAGAQFVKTSTGFGTGGATVKDVRLIRETVGDELGVKASGGIRTFEEAVALVQAGATRIGTSAGVRMVTEG